MLMGPALAVMRAALDQMVVSVGPYIFHSAAPQGSKRPAKSRVSSSPPHSIFKPGEPCQLAASSIFQVVGVACITVTLASSINCASTRPSVFASLGAITISAPQINGRNNSSPAISNDSVVTASSRSDEVRPGVCFIDHRKLVSERCSIWTPLGLPVDPEV